MALTTLLPSRSKITSLRTNVTKNKMVWLEPAPIRLDHKLSRKLGRPLLNSHRIKSSTEALLSTRNRSTTCRSEWMTTMVLPAIWLYQRILKPIRMQATSQMEGSPSITKTSTSDSAADLTRRNPRASLICRIKTIHRLVTAVWRRLHPS